MNHSLTSLLIVAILFSVLTAKASPAEDKDSNFVYKCATPINEMMGLGTEYLIIGSGSNTKIILSTTTSKGYQIEEGRTYDSQLFTRELNPDGFSIVAVLHKTETAAYMMSQILVVNLKKMTMTVSFPNGGGPISGFTCAKVL